MFVSVSPLATFATITDRLRLKVQRNLFRKGSILHCDISDNNIMVIGDNQEYYKQCRDGFDEVKYINQVLAGDRCVQSSRFLTLLVP
jgi:hypothetical protein